jgi:hypothetical protein
MKSKLAIVDKRSPREAIDQLKKIVDDIHLFESTNITYNSISCHPDIFIFQNGSQIIIAPNAPLSLIEFLEKHNIEFIRGNQYIGETLKESCPYNCVTSKNLIIHKMGFTDQRILDECGQKEFISVPQSYTRCSLLHIGNNNFVTSDKGIEKVLRKHGFNCFYFNPTQIRIADHSHGFFGGTAGMLDNKIITLGCIQLHSSGNELKLFLKKLNVEFVSLCDEPLYDGGGIFFIDKC